MIHPSNTTSMITTERPYKSKTFNDHETVISLNKIWDRNTDEKASNLPMNNHDLPNNPSMPGDFHSFISLIENAEQQNIQDLIIIEQKEAITHFHVYSRKRLRYFHTINYGMRQFLDQIIRRCGIQMPSTATRLLNESKFDFTGMEADLLKPFVDQMERISSEMNFKSRKGRSINTYKIGFKLIVLF
jgi:hypothetical protein